jgi:predicted RNase H-like HicB family nuclease
MDTQVPLPILITKEGKWFVASCPILDIATQGKTEREVKENMTELINEYLCDPDTPKPSLDDLMSFSLTNVPVKIPESILHSQTSTAAQAKSCLNSALQRI